MSAVTREGYFDIRATHKGGKRLRQALTLTNERNLRTAVSELRRCQRERPELTLVLIERGWFDGKPERLVPVP
jgi:hypothetical protein